MRRTRWTTVLACFVAPMAFVWGVADLMTRHGGWFPVLTPWGAVVALLMTAVVLIAGLAVRRLRAQEDTWMTHTGAATTAAAAQASAVVGAAVGGIYAGGLATALLAPRSPAMTSLLWSSAACLAACLLWCGVGLLVEHWCTIDMSDDDDEPGPSTSEGLPA